MASLFNPDYLLSLCKKYNLTPSKQYGQNYLIDEAVIEKIITAAEIHDNDAVVEVGPGFGALTLTLAAKAKQVISFEIEKKLLPYWEEKQKHFPNIQIEWGNVLYQFASTALTLPSGYKVVANLPYQITSPVIRLFLETEKTPAEMIFMVQKEVAERLAAKPGDMSLLAVSAQYYASVQMVTIVPRTAFWPSPAVDSAVIKIISKHEPRNNEFERIFFSFVRAGFANRRKLLFKNLLPVVGKKNKVEFEKVFNELKLLPTARAQELSIEQWKELAKKCSFFTSVK